MTAGFAAALIALGSCCAPIAFAANPHFGIAVPSDTGANADIGRDIARFVAPDAGIDLEVVPSAGSIENVRRLRYEPGVKFAVVESDTLQALADQAAGGNAEASELARPLRVIVPLYREEMYFIVRADSPARFVHEMRGARINVGPVASDASVTTTTLYRAMFDEPLAEGKATFLSTEDALVKLITDQSVDVVAMVARQPATLLANMKPESKQYIKLLKFDRDHISSLGALKSYSAATVHASSYPNLLSEDVPALAVRTYLVTYDLDMKNAQGSMVRFARSLCRNLPTLRAQANATWREVDHSLPDLGGGWSYYPPMVKELRGCSAGK